jgi:hypothetical protein
MSSSPRWSRRGPVALALCGLLAGAAHAGPARPAANAAAWCEANPGTGYTFTRDRKAWFATDDDPAGREEHRVVWRGRADPDRRTDVLIDEGSCGTRECLHALYVRCPDGTYARAWGPEYAARVRVQRRAGGWAVLKVEHVGDADAKGRAGRFWSPVRFGASGYD